MSSKDQDDKSLDASIVQKIKSDKLHTPVFEILFGHKGVVYGDYLTSLAYGLEQLSIGVMLATDKIDSFIVAMNKLGYIETSKEDCSVVLGKQGYLPVVVSIMPKSQDDIEVDEQNEESTTLECFDGKELIYLGL